MITRILVTGAAGFVGQALVPALRNAFPAAELYAAGSTASPTGSGLLTCDIADRKAVSQLIERVQPDCVVNLAAISHIPTSFASPELTWQVNLHGMLHLLDALVESAKPCTVLQVGSGDCYGNAFRGGQQLNEDAPLMPLNPYAASKAAADLAAYSYIANKQLKIIRARPFNHTGAGQSNRFVVPAFAEQIARIEAGLQEPVIKVGNLDAQRCFLHLDDVVDAYVRLLQQAERVESGEAFNIVADAPVSIQSVLDTLIAQASRPIKIHQDPARCRPTDIPVARGDASKLKQLTGWQPRSDLPAIVADVLTYWRNHYQ